MTSTFSSDKRPVASYVRGELGAKGQRYLRGDAIGVVALEFKKPDCTFFAHGAVIDATKTDATPMSRISSSTTT